MTATAIASRLRALELRVSQLEEQVEQLLATSTSLESHQTVEPRGNSTVHNGRHAAVAGAQEPDAVRRAEELFTRLLSENKLASYSGAYKRIVGPYQAWLNAIHAPAIIAIATQTSPRQVGPLAIRLDALIVGKTTRRPAKGHFETATYSESEWIQTFGTWYLMDET